MNHLELAKERISRLQDKELSASSSFNVNMAAVNALIAIAENSVGIFASLSALTSHLAVIAEQLEKMNKRNEVNDNWEENLALWREDK